MSEEVNPKVEATPSTPESVTVSADLMADIDGAVTTVMKQIVANRKPKEEAPAKELQK